MYYSSLPVFAALWSSSWYFVWKDVTMEAILLPHEPQFAFCHC